MQSKMYRNTYAKIDLSAIKHNLDIIKVNLGGKKKIIPVLKANAYGHGSVEIAQFLENQGYDFFAVALLEEAIELRKSGVKATILVLGWVAPRYAYLAIRHNFILTAFQVEWLESIQKLNLQGKLNIHMKIDTGMGRNGLRTEFEIMDFINKLKSIEEIELLGVYTHFATADDKDNTYYNEQVDNFHSLIKVVKITYPHKSLVIHIGNSGASIQYPNDMTDYSRVGVSIYGMYPSLAVKESASVKLKPALELKSEITHVKQTRAGDKISYGSTYITKKGDWIGTVAIGYADGWLRRLQGTEVLVSGKRMEIVGRICMDMLMIKLDQAYEIGTEVTLIGKSGDATISIDEIASKLETINYEVTTNLSSRIPRIYAW